MPVLEGGQTGHILYLLSSMSTHPEPAATPIVAIGGSPPGSSSLSALVSVRWGALGLGAGRGRARRPGDGRGTPREVGLGEGPGPPPPAPCSPRPRARSSSLRGESR